jgi:AcrR family transcriptional regulator
MSPRPRETSDQEILAAAARVMQRIGPARFTLADVAKEAGVVPATLIQRFRTKRSLLLAVCGSTTIDVTSLFAAARDKHKSPLNTLIELYGECTGFASTPEELANGLAYLQIDLTDEEFRVLALRQFREIRSATEKLLGEAMAARELRPCDTSKLARLMQSVFHGSMIAWGIYREGTVVAWVRADIEGLLAPFRRGNAGGARR